MKMRCHKIKGLVISYPNTKNSRFPAVIKLLQADILSYYVPCFEQNSELGNRWVQGNPSRIKEHTIEKLPLHNELSNYLYLNVQLSKGCISGGSPVSASATKNKSCTEWSNIDWALMCSEKPELWGIMAKLNFQLFGCIPWMSLLTSSSLNPYLKNENNTTEFALRIKWKTAYEVLSTDLMIKMLWT